MKRHPDLSLRSPTPLSTVRARMLNHVVADKYYNTLEQILVDSKPFKVWNMDETSSPLMHKPTKVIAACGAKNIPGRVGNCRDNISVLCCIESNGGDIPPMCIVRGKTVKCLNAYDTSRGPNHAVYTYQAKAWMEDVLGVFWFQNHFLRFCGPERPQLMILDSHSSHETLGLIQTARENDIILLAFPPHTTQWLCPLDKSVFSPLQREYNRVCSEFMARSPNNIVNKWEWPGLFKDAYDKAFNKSNIKAGFQKCGIAPFNANAIPNDAFAPANPFDSMPVSMPLAMPVSSPTTTSSVPSTSVSQPVVAESTAAYGLQVVDMNVSVPLTLESTQNIQVIDLPDISSQLSEAAISGEVVSLDVTMPMSASQSIDYLFSTPKVAPKVVNTSNVVKSKKITSHRILTHDDIFNLKLASKQEKDKIEEVKNERKRIREENKAKKLEGTKLVIKPQLSCESLKVKLSKVNDTYTVIGNQ